MTDWFFSVNVAEWSNPAEMRRDFKMVGNGKGAIYEFEFGGGYLIAANIVFRSKAVKVEFAGTRDEYEGIARIDE